MVKKVNFSINFSNRVVYTLIASVVLVLVAVGVLAYGGGNGSPAVMGHTLNEIDGLDNYLNENYYNKQEINELIAGIGGGGCTVYSDKGTAPEKCYDDPQIISSSKTVTVEDTWSVDSANCNPPNPCVSIHNLVTYTGKCTAKLESGKIYVKAVCEDGSTNSGGWLEWISGTYGTATVTCPFNKGSYGGVTAWYPTVTCHVNWDKVWGSIAYFKNGLSQPAESFPNIEWVRT